MVSKHEKFRKPFLKKFDKNIFLL
ncbi:Protein CBG27109 [Caenorhabditis briggsae]|uniref:Protein CBG27109 n=1 Tax=Caenorhabditis briggsae TaxID=6238 RepID=B6IHI4_CAEBR|nr:Protein CBG27109 [Caenorhabditis briggsae]CAR99364.1 Protein CBG27109 [Caenorhabditis briggsae]